MTFFIILLLVIHSESVDKCAFCRFVACLASTVQLLSRKKCQKTLNECKRKSFTHLFIHTARQSVIYVCVCDVLFINLTIHSNVSVSVHVFWLAGCLPVRLSIVITPQRALSAMT